MTRTMIKKEFFTDGSYIFELRSNPQQNQAADQQVLLEFCLPYAELKHIVEGLANETSVLQLQYPIGDNKLEVCIPEDNK